uniref:PAX3- and PAX7-binding protein 1-like n=1 Tax=Saccoglossus kowalevskii TaxID=10224 RepID=A0ABM0M5L9_SACKO|nr:PREDICTED: PAX3- and PAX7-binding protein 1-like [Saccoglossus kowalevskii]
MFKKRKNVNLRKRGGSSDEEESKNDNRIPFIDDVKPATHAYSAIEKVKKKKDEKSLMGGGSGMISKSSSSNLLSFDDEEGEGEVFQVKRTIHSKKHVKKFKERKNKPSSLDEKPETAKTSAPANASVRTTAKTEHVAGGGVLNGNKVSSPVIMPGEEDEVQEGEDDLKSPFSNLRPGAIPDAAMIHAARKRRQQAREMGDFIPVDDTQKFESNPSRLVREDDNDRSDNEDESDEERICFTVKPAMTQRQRVIEAIEQVDSDDGEKEHDEELKRWEQEQIKKGTSVPQIQNATEEQTSLNYQNYLAQSGFVNPLGLPPPLMSIDPFSIASDNSAAASPTQNASSLLTKMPPKDLPSVTLDQVKKQLKDRLNSLDEVHRAHQREMDVIQDSLSTSVDGSEKLKRSFGEMEMQYRFFQEMRGYVRDLVECLNEKVPQINSLETQMHNLWKQRSSKLIQRRQDDIKDQSEDFKMKGTKAAVAPNLDAHGRDRSTYESNAKQRRQAEREARRARRRRYRQSIGTNNAHCEGFSSDDEVPDSEIVRFNGETAFTVLAEHVWDPMSSTQSQKLVEFFHRIADDFPPVSAENKQTQILLRAIVNRMRKTLDDDVYVPLFPKTLLDNKASGASAFLQRQFWSCVKLLGNMLMWNGIVSHEILQELSLDGLLNRYLLLSLHNSDINLDSIEKCRMIVSCFPKSWFFKLEGDSTIRQLENLCRYLKHAVSTLHMSCAGGTDVEKRKVRERTKTVIRILADIHAVDHTIDIAKEYKVKDLQSIIGQ